MNFKQRFIIRKIIANTFMTLDGVMQSPSGPEEDSSGNFKYGGWIPNYWDEVMGKTLDEFLANPFELLLGRRTYEIFAAYWPYKENDPLADKYNPVKKYVVSRTLNKLDWNNSFLIKDNAENEIRKLKENNGPEFQVYGSSKLVKTLVNGNLIDLIKVWIFPVTVGKGKQLFGEGTNATGFKLIDIKSSGTGVIIAAYQPAGVLKTAPAEDNPSEAELKRRKKLKEEG